MTIPRISSLRHPWAPPGCFIFYFLFFRRGAYPPRSLYVVVRWHSRISVWTFWLPPWKKVLTKEERRKAPAKLNSFPCQTRRKFVSTRKATFFFEDLNLFVTKNRIFSFSICSHFPFFIVTVIFSKKAFTTRRVHSGSIFFQISFDSKLTH